MTGSPLARPTDKRCIDQIVGAHDSLLRYIGNVAAGNVPEFGPRRSRQHDLHSHLAVSDFPLQGPRIKRVRLTPQGLVKLDEAMKLWSIAQQRFEDMVGKEQAARLRAALDDIAALDIGIPPAAPSA